MVKISEMKWNENDFKVREVKRLMGLKVYQGDFKLANSLELRIALASIEANINLLVQLKERLEAS